LVIGLYGFSTATPIPLFPSLKLHYWASVLEVLRERIGVKVLVVGVKGYVSSRTFVVLS
jgi:triacylglycerol lipase